MPVGKSRETASAIFELDIGPGNHSSYPTGPSHRNLTEVNLKAVAPTAKAGSFQIRPIFVGPHTCNLDVIDVNFDADWFILARQSAPPA